MAYPAESPLPDLCLGDLGVSRLHAELNFEMADPAGIFGTVAPVGKDDLLLAIFLREPVNDDITILRWRQGRRHVVQLKQVAGRELPNQDSSREEQGCKGGTAEGKDTHDAHLDQEDGVADIPFAFTKPRRWLMKTLP